MSSSTLSPTDVQALSIAPPDWRAGKYFAKVDKADRFTDPPFEKLDRDQIRVLELHPGARHEELKCSVRVCTLDTTVRKITTASNEQFQRVPFEAVSYVWGSADRKHSLNCNKVVFIEAQINGQDVLAEMYQEHFDTILPITENVKNMLIDLRGTTDSRSLWIDGICINQDDHEERAEQVRHMRTIYSFAERVIVWLGTDEFYNAPRACATARKLASIHRDAELWRMGISLRDESEDWQTYGFHAWRLSKSHPLHLNQDAYRALRDHLLDRDWFRRTWVYQELALARGAVLRWGDEEITWEVLEDAIQTMTGLSIPLAPFNSGHKAVLNMARKRQAVAMVREYVAKYGTKETIGETRPVDSVLAHELLLHRLLYDVRSLQATDPHDKVYGVLGLLLTADEPVINIDYAAPVRELYIQIAQLLMPTSSTGFDGSLKWLSHVQIPDKELNLPSWVADWSTPWVTKCICYLGFFQAATARDAKFKFFSPNGVAYGPENLDEKREDYSILQIAGIKVLELDEVFDVDNYEKQADVLSRMPANYPLATSSYLELYLNIFDANEPANFQLGSHRDSNKTFWKDCLIVAKGDADKSDTASNESTISNTRITDDMLHARFDRPRLEGVVASPQTRDADRPLRNKHLRAGFVSTNGFMGVVPKMSRPGDRIVLLLGASVPFVIRQVEDGYHEFIGECYVFGLMDGEGLEELDEDRIEQLLLH